MCNLNQNTTSLGQQNALEIIAYKCLSLHTGHNGLIIVYGTFLLYASLTYAAFSDMLFEAASQRMAEVLFIITSELAFAHVSYSELYSKHTLKHIKITEFLYHIKINQTVIFYITSEFIYIYIYISFTRLR